MSDPDLNLAQIATENPAAAVDHLIRTTHAAGTAHALLASESTETNAARGFDRTLEGVVDFEAGRALLAYVSEGSAERTLVIGGQLFRSHGRERWVLVSDREGGRDNLTLDGFGLLSLARGADETLHVEKRADGAIVLEVIARDSVLFDDLSATDILQVPTALLVEPLRAKIATDAFGRITDYCVESTRSRPRLSVQRRRVRLSLSEFGMPVDIRAPDPGSVRRPRRRRSLFHRARRRLGYPALDG
ncbi:MAG: hypothetical protein ACJ76Z_10455 [Thermoleophilaceae bacterium]